MKHKVNNILKSLSRLPYPTRRGEVHRVPIMLSLDDLHISPDNGDSECTEEVQLLTVVAERFNKGQRSWLEWMIDMGD